MATREVTTAAARLEFDTQNSSYNSACMVDANHFVALRRGWSAGANDKIQVFTVDTTTWAVTTAAASLEFDTYTLTTISSRMVDANHVLTFRNFTWWDWVAQVFTINTTTRAVTTTDTWLEFDTVFNVTNSCFRVDTNHFINFWRGNADNPNSDYLVQVFTVNTTTWAVTTAAARLQFDTNLTISYNACFQIDTNHFINFRKWSGADWFVQVFTVNTTTWAVTTAAAQLEFDTQVMSYPSCYQIDSNHFINFWLWWAATTDWFVQVFTVDTTTWAVTTAAASILFDTDVGTYNSCYQVDSNHFINFWSWNSGDWFVQVFTVNTTTWAVTTAAASLEFDTADGNHNFCIQVDANHFVNLWAGSWADWFVQVFTVELPSGSLIKTIIWLVKASVKAVKWLVIASVKSINWLQ
jgi:hypothetical protein